MAQQPDIAKPRTLQELTADLGTVLEGVNFLISCVESSGNIDDATAKRIQDIKDAMKRMTTLPN